MRPRLLDLGEGNEVVGVAVGGVSLTVKPGNNGRVGEVLEV